MEGHRDVVKLLVEKGADSENCCKVEELPCLSWTYYHCKTFESCLESIQREKQRACVVEHENFISAFTANFGSLRLDFRT